MSTEKILIIDDEEGIRESLSGILLDEGYEVEAVDSGEKGLEAISADLPDLVFLDIWLPGIDGLETLNRIRESNPDLAVVMISGHGNIETAVNATRSGAYDFLEKPLSLDRVLLVAGRALERITLERENRELRRTLERKWTLVGESPAICEIRSQIGMAAKSNSRVLITGESGTGKEIVAHLLHALSPRADKPFVELNCAAIPQELIESELFGHEKGSFTGAFDQKKGKFELASGGTLFLDEIGDMSFNTQAKLLRVLEGQTFQRVGGSKNISVDVRVIAATNKDIERMIKEDKFRGDLFFRLNVIPISLPPLKARKEDISVLVDHFLAMLASEHGQPRKTLSTGSMEKLIQHDWPGNIRELKNLVERLVIMTDSEIIENVGIEGGEGQGDYFLIKTLKAARDSFEKDYIQAKLKQNDWNISKTAEDIGVERSNLHRKIKSLGIETP
jgi:two-component system nitrogen regulation response regulator NtrX